MLAGLAVRRFSTLPNLRLHYLKKHRDDDPEPIEVHVWYDEHYKSSTAHIIYEGEWALPVSLARELDGAVFDGMTIMTGVIHVQ